MSLLLANFLILKRIPTITKYTERKYGNTGAAGAYVVLTKIVLTSMDKNPDLKVTGR